MKRGIKEERGQDLVEYAILAAFVAIMVVLVLIQSGEALSGIWESAGGVLSDGKTAAEGGRSDPPAPAAAAAAAPGGSGRKPSDPGAPDGKGKGKDKGGGR